MNALVTAIRYAPALWNGLSRCITNGLLEVSINAAERGMKPPVMRRSFCSSSSTNWKHWVPSTEREKLRAIPKNANDSLKNLVATPRPKYPAIRCRSPPFQLRSTDTRSGGITI
jgi:hypothetical protein